MASGEFNCEHIIWVGEPSQPGTDRGDGTLYFRPYTTWNYKTKESDLHYIMNENDYQKYLAEKEMLRLMHGKTLDRAALVEAIKKYGEICYQEGGDDEAEQHADASL